MNDRDRRPTVVIYGNCQADATTNVFNKHPGFAERYRAVYYPGYDHPTLKPGEIPDEDLAGATVLLEQRDQLGFTGRERLPRDIRTVKFPAIDFNLYWPLTSTNPYANPPAGGSGEIFPYGDRVILNCVKKGMKADEILDYYLTGWSSYYVDLHRLAALETARIGLRDSQSDLKFGSLVLGRFRDEQLFWTVNHPTAPLLAEMITRLLAAAFPSERWTEEAHMEKFITDCFSWRGPLGKVGVPIHPEVAAYLGLSWYDPNATYMLESGRLVSYEDYFTELIGASVERHALAAAS